MITFFIAAYIQNIHSSSSENFVEFDIEPYDVKPHTQCKTWLVSQVTRCRVLRQRIHVTLT